MRLAEAGGLDRETPRKVYHHAILRKIGCNADTHFLAPAFGDEIALRQDLAVMRFAGKRIGLGPAVGQSRTAS